MADEAAELRMVLADIILHAVLHPEHDRYEIVDRQTLDKARMYLDREDVNAAAERGRQRRQ